MIDLKSMTIAETEEYLKQLGEPRFRAGQLFEWIQKKRAVSFDEMTSLSKSLREKLGGECFIEKLNILTVQESKFDGTRKYLFGLRDGNCVESVFMRYHHGNSVCISTQVGCRMGCRFCASTVDGLERNLTAGEMLDQVMRIEADTGERVSNVVLMGSGEPMDNYDNVLRLILTALRLEPWDELPQTITCSDDDFKTMMLLGEKLMRHALHITESLVESAPNPELNVLVRSDAAERIDRLFEKLPTTFKYAKIKSLCDELEITERTLDRYLHDLLEAKWIVRLTRGSYKKVQ